MGEDGSAALQYVTEVVASIGCGMVRPMYIVDKSMGACGYGGSCFPKDMQALIRISRQYGYESKMLEAVECVNANQKKIIPEKVAKRFGSDLRGKTFAVWGISFKPDTDDMRESLAITIIKESLDKGAEVMAYDPKAMGEAQMCYLKECQGIGYVDSKYEGFKRCRCAASADGMEGIPSA